MEDSLDFEAIWCDQDVNIPKKSKGTISGLKRAFSEKVTTCTQSSELLTRLNEINATNPSSPYIIVIISAKIGKKIISELKLYRQVIYGVIIFCDHPEYHQTWTKAEGSFILGVEKKNLDLENLCRIVIKDYLKRMGNEDSGAGRSQTIISQTDEDQNVSSTKVSSKDQNNLTMHVATGDDSSQDLQPNFQETEMSMIAKIKNPIGQDDSDSIIITLDKELELQNLSKQEQKAIWFYINYFFSKSDQEKIGTDEINSVLQMYSKKTDKKPLRECVIFQLEEILKTRKG